MSIQEDVIQKFVEQFNKEPSFVVQAPGRVNLIGEHTDYNDGFVLPMAIDRSVIIALRPRSDELVSVQAIDMGETAVFDLNNLVKEDANWVEYLKGVAWALQEAGNSLNGWEGVLGGNVPRGAGLSSSAAVELATARAFHAVSDFEWQPAEMAKLGQKTENEWLGVQTGIMDQMISALGQEGHALLIDCRSLESEAVPLPHGVEGSETAVVILDTNTRRGLVDSAYNERRTQCEKAARTFGVRALRDVSLQQFLENSHELDPLTAKRAKHVITENVRTLNAAKAMQDADVELLGQLMDESHISLRDDFEVSSTELDQMASFARSQPGCYGARMTGAGFGGCAVALVRGEAVDAFVTAVAEKYKLATNLEPKIYVCQPSSGASTLTNTK